MSMQTGLNAVDFENGALMWCMGVRCFFSHLCETVGLKQCSCGWRELLRQEGYFSLSRKLIKPVIHSNTKGY